MPVVNVVRDELFEFLGQKFSDEEFDELCFQFGIELDEVTNEAAFLRKEKGNVEIDASKEDVVIYKIEIPANRYDMLCIEGISMALKQFLGKQDIPNFQAKPFVHKVTVTPETSAIRPFFAAAVLRGVTFTKERYNSFIDLQDKLHFNICRKRTLVAIGTHDLDTIRGPFTYEALPPEQIRFAPLNQTKEFNGVELMEHFENDHKIKKFLPIIRDSPVYPVIYDSDRRVLSLPPIINGDHSKISYETKNVFIEVTAKDLTKAEVVLNTICGMYAQYCAEPFTIEQVEVTNPNMTPNVRCFPDLTPRIIEGSVEYLNRISGLTLAPTDMTALLRKMSLHSTVVDQSIRVTVPITRSDVLHACDVAEDLAISFGYNNVPLQVPTTSTVGKQQPVNRLTDALRLELAMSGYCEVLTFSLCSHAEAYKNMQRVDDHTAVILDNPKTIEFEVVRPSLLPGLLKSLFHNKGAPIPIKMFEVSDVCMKDATSDVGAKNERRLAVLHASHTTGFEYVHGILDRIMQSLSVAPTDYHIGPGSDPAFFPKRCADIFYKGNKIGVFGAIHPQVLNNYDITHPTSALEINIEPFI